jgi:hypothetical protein
MAEKKKIDQIAKFQKLAKQMGFDIDLVGALAEFKTQIIEETRKDYETVANQVVKGQLESTNKLIAEMKQSFDTMKTAYESMKMPSAMEIAKAYAEKFAPESQVIPEGSVDVEGLKKQIITEVAVMVSEYGQGTQTSFDNIKTALVGINDKLKVVNEDAKNVATEQAKAVYDSGNKELIDTVNKHTQVINKLIQQGTGQSTAVVTTGGGEEEEAATIPSNGAGMAMMLINQIIQALPTIADAWSKFRPAPQGLDLKLLIQGMTIGQKIKAGELKIEDIGAVMLPQGTPPK